MNLSAYTPVIESAQERYQNYEVEAVFGLTSEVPLAVNAITHHILQRKFHSYPTVKEDSTVTVYGDGVRRIETASGSTWQTKQKLQVITVQDFNLRLNISSEESTPPATGIPTGLKRERQRTTITLAHSKLDLTIVTTSGQVRYEVELELLNGKSLSGFYKEVELVYMTIFSTRTLYSTRQKEALAFRVNQLLGSTRLNHIDRSSLVETRPLKPEDVVYGGIVGGLSTFIGTVKPDGMRCLLIFHETGVWFAYPPGYYNRILPPVDSTKIRETILDGELIIVSPTKYLFLPFDCLAFQGTGITNQPYRERLAKARLIRLKTETLEIRQKPTRELRTPFEFFKSVNELLAETHTDYQTDGLVFTPADAPYLLVADQSKTRRLSDQLEVVKWKPLDKITIDFLVRREGDDVLLFNEDEKRQLVQFSGTTHYPYSDQPDGESDLLKDRAIVEFAWNGSALTPLRIREDRIGPNSVFVAKSNWNDMRGAALSVEDLTGVGLKLVFKYHNRIKRALLTACIPKTRSTLIDVGTGRGGDISKWCEYPNLTVIALEPNSDNYQEFLRRAGTCKAKLIPENVSLQDYTSSTRATVIVFFSCLTFFWKNEEQAREVQEFVKKHSTQACTVLWLALDGDALDQAYLGSTENTLTFGNLEGVVSAKIVRSVDNSISTTIARSIVGSDQQEYPVYPSDLRKLLAELDFRNAFQSRATRELLLSSTQRAFSSLYSYGVFYRGTMSEGLMALVAAERAPILHQVPVDLPITTRSNSVDLPPGVTKFTFGPASPTPLTTVPAIMSSPSQDLDDIYDVLNLRGTKKLTRLGTIPGRGHAILKACYKPYQDAETIRERLKLERQFRDELAVYVERVWDETDNHNFVRSLILSLGGNTVARKKYQELIRTASETERPYYEEGLRQAQIAPYNLSAIQTLLTQTEHCFIRDRSLLQLVADLSGVEICPDYTYGGSIIRGEALVPEKQDDEVSYPFIAYLESGFGNDTLADFRSNLLVTTFEANDGMGKILKLDPPPVVMKTVSEVIIEAIHSLVEAGDVREFEAGARLALLFTNEYPDDPASLLIKEALRTVI